MNNKKVLLEVKDVDLSFGGLSVLNKVSFDVRGGEILALIGPNGAGKSSILNVITGFYTPNAGQVLLEGKNLVGMSADKIVDKGVVRTFQAAEILFELNVRENVVAASMKEMKLFAGAIGMGWKYGRPSRSGELADQCLELVGLGDVAERSAAQLTAGQQRLLAAARALATGAEILFLDEPGAGLNHIEKELLVNAILRIRKSGVTVVFVEHDLTFVSKLAERIVVLNYGQVLAKGEAEAVRTDPKVIDAYLGNTEINRRRDNRSERSNRRLLTAANLSASHGAVQALEDVSLHVDEGEIVSLIGANGAGKSTLLGCISGRYRPSQGTLEFAGRSLRGIAADKRPGLGIALAPEGRSLFGSLTVEENLMMGYFSQLRRSGLSQLIAPRGEHHRAMLEVMEEVMTFFPKLRQRRHQQAGTLSGGEGQMVNIARALMSRPQLLMLDEPSFGLAPQVTREILESLPDLTRKGVSILIIEQNAKAALQMSDRGYVLVNGSIVAEGQSNALLERADINEAFLGWQESTESEHERVSA
ncbi:Branched-chain amino acid transport ATP-binding protein LivF [Marinobacterium lacunae]|uniref:Branched-chain amino acid transport ATP-binding protein LivF n=1 Tax=Marinobacterium lacunae TaxID=1232683 RepID=A0A081G0Z6_9GAMM|nr:ATP-binding cassette domain-containing protein [Marinobacterium lacunae]KEA64451.1 Branched-chain amino acid transport ATP-binding protein LivF [Marinobacterium lacunae]